MRLKPRCSILRKVETDWWQHIRRGKTGAEAGVLFLLVIFFIFLPVWAGEVLAIGNQIYNVHENSWSNLHKVDDGLFFVSHVRFMSLLGQYKMNYSHNGLVEVQLGMVKEKEKMAMQYTHRKWW